MKMLFEKSMQERIEAIRNILEDEKRSRQKEVEKSKSPEYQQRRVNQINTGLLDLLAIEVEIKRYGQGKA